MNSFSITTTCLLLLLALCLPVAADLDDGTRRSLVRTLDGKLESYDTDGDSALSAGERAALVTAVGKEYGKRWVLPLQKLFEEADGDRDGLLTEPEWKAYAKPYLQPAWRPEKKTYRLEMADGAKLATDVYLPKGEGPWPVLLMRTPYNKNRANPLSGTRNGYALVFQDQRGRYESEGENLPFVGCGWDPYRDGKETLAWIAKQGWCNGRIGTQGGSALGITQNLLAGSAPGPELEAQYINVAAASLYHHATYVGGVLRKSQIEVWVRGNRYDAEAIPTFRAHPSYDEFWHRFDTTRRHAEMTVPAVHTGGWFDTFSLGTVASFAGRQHQGGEGAKGRQKLVMGPWAHGGRGTGKVGDLTFPNSKFPPAYSAQRWFEHYLKGQDNGVEKLPAVAYYVMGESGKKGGPGNEWRHADDWPVPHRPVALYLRSDGRLTSEEPPADAAPVEYTFDPKSPCPTVGGGNLVLPPGPKNQNRIEGRPDVVTFTTGPLDEPVEVTGQAKAVIHIASSAVDTDLSVRLCDVYPDGKSYLMAEGMLRLRYREGFGKPVPLTPGELVEVEIECWPTSVVFDVGHRIRVTVTSSNNPRFEVNPGTGKPIEEGGELVKQTNRISCDAAHPSRIVLPVVE